MVELTRTLQQWWATARRLEQQTVGRPDLAEQIRWAFPSTTNADPDTPLTVLFTSDDGAVIEQQAPLFAWWMPPTQGWMLQPRGRSRSTSSGEGDASCLDAVVVVLVASSDRRDGMISGSLLKARAVLVQCGIGPDADMDDLTAVLKDRGWRVSLEQTGGGGGGRPPRWNGQATLPPQPGRPVFYRPLHVSVTGQDGRDVLIRLLAKALEKERDP